MDLGTVEKRLKSGAYTNPNQFADDMRLIWNNAMTYNPKQSPIYLMTVAIKEFFEKTFKEVEENPYNESFSFNTEKAKSFQQKIQSFPLKAQAQKLNIDSDKPMSYEEKKELSESINSRDFRIFEPTEWYLSNRTQ